MLVCDFEYDGWSQLLCHILGADSDDIEMLSVNTRRIKNYV